jgi:hypothetical protein
MIFYIFGSIITRQLCYRPVAYFRTHGFIASTVQIGHSVLDKMPPFFFLTKLGLLLDKPHFTDPVLVYCWLISLFFFLGILAHRLKRNEGETWPIW